MARYGGEEFAVILPDMDVQGALHVAETIRAEIINLKIPHAFSEVNRYVTLSIGVATMLPTPAENPPTLIEAADTALYKAKNQERNQVVGSLNIN